MSKLYDKYLELKENDETTVYLFHSGIFYIFLDNDAKIMSKKLNLKLTLFTKEVLKCGFPSNAVEEYLKKLKEDKISYKIVEWESRKPKKREKKEIANTNFQDTKDIKGKIISKLNEINVYQITPLQALELLVELKEMLNHGA